MPVTFTPPVPPQEEPNGDVSFNVRETKFGEGYVQTVGDGINTKRQDWSFTFHGTDAEITSIKNFFDARNGYETFYYTPPYESTAKLFIVKRYQLIPSAAGNGRITATFEQRFAP